MTTTLFRKDARVEMILDELGVEWEYDPRFELNRIDVPASLQNQVRMGNPILPDIIASYARDIDRGIGPEFPAPVANRGQSKSKGMVVLIDGNQRTQATLKSIGEWTHVGIYLIGEADRNLLRDIGVKINMTNGARLTEEEQELYIVNAHLDQGVSIAEAANVAQKDYSQAKTIIQREIGVRRAIDAGFPIARKEPARFTRLQALTNTDVFHRAAKFVATTKIPSKAIGAMVTEMNGVKGDPAQQKKILDTWRTTEPWKPGPKRRKTWDGGVMNTMSRVQKLKIQSREDFTEGQRIKLLKAGDEALTSLMNYLNALKT